MTVKARVLLVDDEANTLKVLSAILRKNGYEVAVAGTAEEGLQRVSQSDFDAIVTDYRLPGINGAEFVARLRQGGAKVPVIVLTAYGSIEKAVDAMRKGAFSYLSKPVNSEALLVAIREAVEKHLLLRENISLKSRLRERHSFKNIIGKSKPMQDLFSLIEAVSGSSSSVLISGESGTGKELVAKAIHYSSARGEGPFIPIDCAALPEHLLESELFGHEKGAFTNAHERKYGQIELAQGGTVFLDEVGELPVSLQKKFLRFLQEREILRVGGNSRIKVDVRIIAATNRDLEARVKEGLFREDLFYRLHVVTISVPPLRERRDDIPLLARHFLARFNEENNKTIGMFETDVMQILLDHHWPGNVRQLENVIERAVVLCPAETITTGYLPKNLRGPEDSPERLSGRRMSLLETERKLILGALENNGWNQTRSAEVLGISRKQLRTKMKNHGFLQEE